MRQDPRMLKPYIMVGHKSEKPCNTTVVLPKAHMGKRCDMGIYKDSINYTRINKMMQRARLNKARFVPAPLLVRKNGQRKAAVRKAA